MSRGTKHSRRNSLFRLNMRRNSSVPELTFRWFEGANAPLIAMTNKRHGCFLLRGGAARGRPFWDWQGRRRSQFAFEIGRIGMPKAALYAACGLAILAAVLPFTPLGVWAVVPMVAATFRRRRPMSL